MLTPRFEISQTEIAVCITVYAPYTNIKSTEIYVDKEDFRFFSHPYYLRLYFPCELVDIGASNAAYDANNGNFVITVEKANKGEIFPDLDLIHTLLVPKSKPILPNIELLDSEGEDEPEDEIDETEDDHLYKNDETDCLVEQTLSEPPSSETMLFAPKYGFKEQYSQVFKLFTYEVKEILDLPEPDITPKESRRKLRLEWESADFDEDHYLADWADHTDIDKTICFVTLWDHYFKTGKKVTFNEYELDRLKDLPIHGFISGCKNNNKLHYGLVDILAAYCYDYRTTDGDPTPESGWTINKLSSTLSWLEVFSDLKDVLLAFLRRSLCYPLYRHWDLSMKVLNDVKVILKLGKKFVLRCLLQIHHLFNKSEPRYLLNRIYIEDYCIWIQKVDDGRLLELSDHIDVVMPKKDDLQLDIVQLEIAAELVQQEEVEIQRKKEEESRNSEEDKQDSEDSEEESVDEDSQDIAESHVKDGDDKSVETLEQPHIPDVDRKIMEAKRREALNISLVTALERLFLSKKLSSESPSEEEDEYEDEDEYYNSSDSDDCIS